MTHPSGPMAQEDRTGTDHDHPPFQQGLLMLPSSFVAAEAGMSTELVLASRTTRTTISTTKDMENTSDDKHNKQGERQEEHDNPHTSTPGHVGTAGDNDNHHDSFLYIHYDRMCHSATAQDNHHYEHYHEDDDERSSPRDHSSCCHNILVLPPSSIIPGHQQDHEPKEEQSLSVKADEEEQHTHHLHSFSSAVLRDGRIPQTSLSARVDDHDVCPDTSDSEDSSFDDEIFRLFGEITNEQQGAMIVRSKTVLSSLKPRTTPRATEEDSIIMGDSFMPSSVTPDAETLTTSITRTKFKLVSPSPQPVFLNCQESPVTAQNIFPFEATTTTTTTSCASAVTTKGSLPWFPAPSWWQSHQQDDIQHDSVPTSGPASTQKLCPLSKEIPFPAKQPEEEVAANPVGGGTTYATIMSSHNRQETFVLPRGIPMTPPPLLFSACHTTTITAATRTRSATSPRPLVPILIDKALSPTSLDPETSIDSPVKAHLVSPMLPSSHVRASSKTISAFATHDDTRNPSTTTQDQQARKRLLFGEEDELKKESGLCSPASLSVSHQVRRKKKSHCPPSLREKDNHDFDNDGSSLQSMITIRSHTTTNKFLLGPSWQSPPGTAPPTPAGSNDPCTFNPTPRDDHHKGASPATPWLYPHDPRPVVAGKEKGMVEAASASSSSSMHSTSDTTKRLHFWDFQSRTWTARFREAKAYRLKNGHCRIPENYPENIALGRWAKRQRSLYKIHQRTSSCQSSWWGGKNIEMKYHHQNHDGHDTTSKKTTIIPDNVQGSIASLSSSANPSLVYCLEGQMTNCPGKVVGVLHHDQAEGATFEARSSCPRPTMSTSSSIRPTTTNNDDDNWKNKEIDAKRRHGRHSPAVERSSSCNPLTDERIRLLDSIGFVWDLQASDWFHRYDQLLDFKRMHGHTDVPQKYPQNQPLSTWVRTQRRSYTRGCMVSDRIELLDRMGFDWGNPSAQKRKSC